MEKVDGIVIGAGHNGLITAAYLARAGLRMLVIEHNPEIGGGTTTDKVTLPGFRHNLHASFHFGCVDSPWFRDLVLQRYGFSYILLQVMVAMAYPDGTCMTLHQDPGKTAASIARISKTDAESFRELHEMFSVKMRPVIQSDAARPLANYSECVVAGPFVFAGGQIASDYKTSIPPEARTDPAFPYYGSDIKRQTDYILGNLSKTFEATRSSLDDVIKAQVFMRDLNEFFAFDEVWKPTSRRRPSARPSG